MKIHSALFVLLLLTGCEPLQDDSQPHIVLVENPVSSVQFETASTVSSDLSAPSPYDAFKVLPDSLMKVIGARVPMSSQIVIRPKHDDLITSEILVKQLFDQQTTMELLLIDAGNLLTEFPPVPNLTDAEMKAGKFHDSIQLRLSANSRFLLADAIRCWSAEDFEGCTQRYIASLQIGVCLIRDDDSMNFIQGACVLRPILLEFDFLISEGLDEQVTFLQRNEIGKLVAKVGDHWPVTQNMDSLVGQAWKRLDLTFNAFDSMNKNLALNDMLTQE
ncbi:MAG: hypothetical protein O7G85_05890 [Planctomycetota bacterium]|nr:hypothetical protein [Planctomycetota bacterium]